MAPRPLYVAGLVGALWCIGIGLAVFTTITLIGWIAAPRTALGPGLPGVFRTAVNFWLVAHHAGFSVAHGRVGLLPLGVIVLPGALLYRSGGWMMRVTGVAGLPRRQRVGVVHVALALAAPYAVLSALLALAAASKVVKASVWQALIACFLVAILAGGLGAARAVVASGPNGRVRSGLGALLKLLPDRARSLVVGVAGSMAVLLAAGALLVGGSLAMHMSEAGRLYDELAPGIVGGALLILVELAFLPNAIIWGMSYAIGPGFSVGAHTSVSPTGVFLDIVPAFPPLAALPEPGPAPLLSLFAMAAPFAAGAVGGVLTVRAMPSPVYEAAPLWGFVSGAMTGAVAALLAALSGGPLGGGRMATVGPSAWQVGLLAALEVGISAAIAAWAANWLILRRPAKPANQKAPARKRRWRRSSPPTPRPATRTATTGATAAATATSSPAEAAPPPRPTPAQHKAPAHGGDPLEFEEAEPVLAPRKPNRGRLRPGEPLPDLAEEIAEPSRPAKPEAKPARPRPEPTPEPEPRPDPRPDTRWVKHEDILIEEPEPQPEPEPAPAREPEPQSERAEEAVPPPREDPGRTENRGGAIYVLREEPPQE